MSDPLPEELQRFASAITHALNAKTPFVAEVEAANAIQVERGLAYASAIEDVPGSIDFSPFDRLAEIAALNTPESLGNVIFLDRAGHRRPAYRPLVLYAWMQTYRLAFGSRSRSASIDWSAGLASWCEVLALRLNALNQQESRTSANATDGAAVAEAAWCALALGVAGDAFGRAEWSDRATRFFAEIAAHRSDAGAFLRSGSSDNPETYWFHELVLLHAVTSYAVHARDASLAIAAGRAAFYHQDETQPDHATSQPWALNAFLLNPETHPLADQVLHSMRMSSPNGPDGVSAVLLADALHCLRRSVKKEWSPAGEAVRPQEPLRDE